MGIKPSELLFRNIETNFGFGNTRYRFGIILSYRPPYADSAVLSSGEGGMPKPSGYGTLNYENPVYHSYAVGFYYKRYSKKHPSEFNEVDVFYRNWHCNKEHVSYSEWGHKNDFNGTRTDNVNVYGIKLLTGETFQLAKKSASRKVRPYFDIYGGVGLRYRSEYYQTFNGVVDGVYYSYLQQHDHAIWPSLHAGIRIGLLK